MTYQDNGLLSTLKRFSDLAATTTVATTTYLYDLADRLTSLYDYKANGTVLASFTYAYDAAGWHS